MVLWDVQKKHDFTSTTFLKPSIVFAVQLPAVLGLKPLLCGTALKPFQSIAVIWQRWILYNSSIFFIKFAQIVFEIHILF